MRATGGIGALALLTLLSACGGGGGGGGSGVGPAPAPPTFTSVPQVQVSQPATFGACNGVTQTGTLFGGTALEPTLLVNPTNPANLVAEYQQDRWSNGGSQALNLAASFDGGMTWTVSSAAFSVCTGGGPANAGNFLRASNGWLTVSPDGTMYALSLSFTGGALAAGSSGGMLVARSANGGQSWSLPIALISDGAAFFNDKGAITADPADANFVYAVWDRLSTQNTGPSYFTLTSNGGASWQSAVSIYDPGVGNQTIGNVLVVLPTGVLMDLFTELDTPAGGATTALLRVISSANHGTTWSAPVTVAGIEAVGTVDPQTGTHVRDAADLFSVAVSPGGVVYAAWQDARFSNGQQDGIAFAQSSDGGQTWSAPVQVNADTSAAAFVPTVAVRADGVIAVTYYDLRNDTSDPNTLYTDAWMVTSPDGTTFTESHLSGPFDLDLAPTTTMGKFLGDYEGLASLSNAFLPVYSQTNAGAQVSSDVFIVFPGTTAAAATAFRARALAPGAKLPALGRQRVMERAQLTRVQRLQRGR